VEGFAIRSCALRPWNDRRIVECHEPLQALPDALLRLHPHPYVALGAPYGVEADPFRLRSGVVRRLLEAQQALQVDHPTLCFAIFDAWRPVSVQAFMVDHAIAEECERRGLTRDAPEQVEDVNAVIRDVARFWASPSMDPAMPPPHSTGAAVDLTLASVHDQRPLEMGGDIDAIGVESEPDHYLESARLKPHSVEATWQCRRDWLRKVMQGAGFEQHPNEWWHFSYGDQLWAWKSGAAQAVYAGAVDAGSPSSNAATASSPSLCT